LNLEINELRSNVSSNVPVSTSVTHADTSIDTSSLHIATTDASTSTDPDDCPVIALLENKIAMLASNNALLEKENLELKTSREPVDNRLDRLLSIPVNRNRHGLGFDKNQKKEYHSGRTINFVRAYDTMNGTEPSKGSVKVVHPRTENSAISSRELRPVGQLRQRSRRTPTYRRFATDCFLCGKANHTHHDCTSYTVYDPYFHALHRYASGCLLATFYRHYSCKTTHIWVPKSVIANLDGPKKLWVPNIA
jgi:hypothetical protein